MKVAPVSGDLLVKLGLAGGLCLVAVYLVKRATAAVNTSWAALPSPNWSYVNPASDQNLIYQGTSGIVSAATGRDETLGGWLYDITHADPVKSDPASGWSPFAWWNGTSPPPQAIPDLGQTGDHAYDAMGNQIY